jgi:hypothetical protein
MVIAFVQERLIGSRRELANLCQNSGKLFQLADNLAGNSKIRGDARIAGITIVVSCSYGAKIERNQQINASSCNDADSGWQCLLLSAA